MDDQRMDPARPEQDRRSDVDADREDQPWDATRAADPDGMPAAAFDRRTMDAQGGEAERDDDVDADDADSPLDAAFTPRSG